MCRDENHEQARPLARAWMGQECASIRPTKLCDTSSNVLLIDTVLSVSLQHLTRSQVFKGELS